MKPAEGSDPTLDEAADATETDRTHSPIAHPIPAQEGGTTPQLMPLRVEDIGQILPRDVLTTLGGGTGGPPGKLQSHATHLGRATFAGEFTRFQLRDISVTHNHAQVKLLAHTQDKYGASARGLSLLDQPQADLYAPPGLLWENGSLVTWPDGGNKSATGGLEISAGAGGNHTLLTSVPLPFAILGPYHHLSLDSKAPFFFLDPHRSFLVLPPGPTSGAAELTYTFKRFYHPYTKLFTQELEAKGLEGLLQRKVQQTPQGLSPADAANFPQTYSPVAGTVTWGDDIETVDFAPDGAYSLYNWEIFYHLPALIAQRLSQNQRFEEARRWFHFIFDPTRAGAENAPQRFWITKPLYDLSDSKVHQQRIDELLQLVNKGDPEAVATVRRWRANPFNPFLVADLRQVAYMKTTVMGYLDNLIAWGDNLFRSDSREALNEATLLYVLAAEILGPRPRRVLPPQPMDKSYADLGKEIDAFGNAIVEAENLLPLADAAAPIRPGAVPLMQLPTFLFKIPPNPKMLGYWDTVGDRLFKLRHCMNVGGVTRELALFDPPIDPGLLIKAAAAGVDLTSVLADTGAPLPHHRYAVMQARAVELCNEVKGLGGAFLAALEKRDAEQVALLRSSHERAVLAAARDVRKAQLDETTQQLDVLTKTRALADGKYQYYYSRQYMNVWETTSVDLSQDSKDTQTGALVADLLASVLHIIPNFKAGVTGAGGTPHAVVSEGGTNLGKAGEIVARGLYGDATLTEKRAAMASVQGSHQRRADDWHFQGDQADLELKQIDSQIAAANLRKQIAQHELDNHDLATRNASEVDEFLHSKFTNADLYDWMVTQLSSIYFQSYQLAFDLARRAERCFRHEIGLTDSSFISFGYWDGLKMGLVAGERLGYDLRRMDAAYLEQSRRRLELTKHVSLSMTDPVAVLTLISTGTCIVELPEMLFDLDYPGHYQRRIKSVSVTIPCVVGPYTGVNCTLTLLRNSVRMNGVAGDSYPRPAPPATDPRFLDQLAPVQSIATSSARDDPGMFELNFHDERYLPFEGAGAISQWKLDLPMDTNNFDLSTVTDVILHIRYTALDGGDALARAARTAVADASPRQGVRVLSARHDYPDAWYRFSRLAQPPADQQLVLDVTPDRFPFYTRGRPLTIDRVELFVGSHQSKDFVAEVDPLLAAGTTVAVSHDPRFGDLFYGAVTPTQAASPGRWTFRLRLTDATDFRSLAEADIDDIIIALHYKVT